MGDTSRIQYLAGPEAYQIQGWAEIISRITANEPHLLPQAPEVLHQAADAGLTLLAVDETADRRIIGFCALWPLGRDEVHREWYEFGTVWVHPDYRHHVSDLNVSDQLYRRTLERTDVCILATTTAKSAMKTGRRLKVLQRVGYDALPVEIRKATCVCPMAKTGSVDPANCQIRDTECVVRVTGHTYEGLGRPSLLPFSFD